MLNLPLQPHVSDIEQLQFSDGIRLVGVHFRYGLEQPDVLRGLDLSFVVVNA